MAHRPTRTHDTADLSIERLSRRSLLTGMAGAGSLLAGCGGGDEGSATGARFAQPAAGRSARLAGPGVAGGRSLRPTVGTLAVGRLSAQTASFGVGSPGFWLVVGAPTDPWAAQALAGLPQALPRWWLPLSDALGSSIRVTRDLPIRHVHIGIAGAERYAIDGTTATLQPGVATRWNFDESDAVQELVISAAPAVVAGDSVDIECLGWSAQAL